MAYICPSFPNGEQLLSWIPKLHVTTLRQPLYIFGPAYKTSRLLALRSCLLKATASEGTAVLKEAVLRAVCARMVACWASWHLSLSEFQKLAVLNALASSADNHPSNKTASTETDSGFHNLRLLSRKSQSIDWTESILIYPLTTISRFAAAGSEEHHYAGNLKVVDGQRLSCIPAKSMFIAAAALVV